MSLAVYSGSDDYSQQFCAIIQILTIAMLQISSVFHVLEIEEAVLRQINESEHGIVVLLTSIKQITSENGSHKHDRKASTRVSSIYWAPDDTSFLTDDNH